MTKTRSKIIILLFKQPLFRKQRTYFCRLKLNNILKRIKYYRDFLEKTCKRLFI